ncbi:MAG: FAD-dependent oxidoreductase, partial [Cyanobacteria bacterium SZAS LIN-2]|nr:FAD-dependent oxidoreductase [Cyanobacteria bacterium SZAS LIN-2]
MKSEVHCSGSTLPALSELVNDKHSRLNPTLVKSRVAPVSAGNMVDFVRMARAAGEKICVAGGRHAMGGQQFLDRGILVDTSNLDKVLHFDGEQGLIEVQAGMRWPQLVDYLRGTATTGGGWAIRQKQTGCDALSIGGALSANIHGRGLRQAPFVSDVEEFKLVTASGELINCSRRENAELFSLAAGGYGLFGLIASATLRLAPRRRLRRRVEMVGADCAVATLEERAAAGASHGDFQFNIDDQADD